MLHSMEDILMKITATRYDDIKKQRDDYDAETDRMHGLMDEAVDRWRTDAKKAKNNLEQKISDLIGSTTLSLSIRADTYSDDRWTIDIQANEHRQSDDNVALSWEWRVSLDDDGNIIKDSGSWSGLKVTTPEQVADLEESVRIIKILNNIDWAEILNSPIPSYKKDYANPDLLKEHRDRVANRPKFEDDMLAAKLEDLIGTNTAIQLIGDEYYRGRVGILLTGMTDKFLKGYIFPWSFVSAGKTADECRRYVYNETRKASKNKIVTEGQGELKTADLR